MNILEQVLAVIGAISTLCTVLAPLFPKGSRVGYGLAKVGTDLKGHTAKSVHNERLGDGE